MGKRLRDESYYQRKAKVDEMMALDAIDNKFNWFLGRAKSVLDLCASTGGWIQLAIGRRIEPVGLAIGVDLHPDPIRPIIGAVSIQGDITTLECKKKIRKLMGESGVTGFDIVMRSGLSSDPNATLWDQASLITESIKLSTEFLAPDGTFVTK
ncbi:hypothetical protein MKW94_023456, partial [Papaver nudicaule]|nr:hypothetical protein [Papaver nudicaule]